jgi:PEP-CTERM motif
MKLKALIAAAGLATLPLSAHAVTITQFGTTNLGTFSYNVVGNVITINETWTNANPVLLRFSGMTTSNYTVIKNITNNTGISWTSLANELFDPKGDGDDANDPLFQPVFVPAGWSTSNDGDGLSFDQGGSIVRTSSLFPMTIADELTDNRDFLDFTGAIAPNGSNFTLQFGLDALGNDGDFLLSQRVNVLSGVPEPTTWALLIAGFGVIGVSMRRRQRVAVSFV